MQDLRQAVLRAGGSEFLIDSYGKRKRVRSWRGGDQGYVYTQQGRSYFAANKRLFWVNISVYVEGTRDRRRQGIELYMPVSHFNLREIYAVSQRGGTDSHRDEPSYRDGKLILHEESNETFFLSDKQRHISMTETVAGQSTVGTRPL